ncbi:MAG: hypothetical protein GY821_08275 [Gammaproteobacteria bacterium]|nr:hypothetical protein [Gammaproteobacteria bacterium]
MKELWQEASRLTAVKYKVGKNYVSENFYFMTHGGKKRVIDKFIVARALKYNIEYAHIDNTPISGLYFKMAQNAFLGMLRVHDDQFRRELRNTYHQVTDKNEHFGLREEYMNYLKDEIVNIWNDVSQKQIKEERQRAVRIMRQPRNYLKKTWSENDIVERLWANFIPLLIMETSINYYNYIQSTQLDKKIKELDIYQEHAPNDIFSIIALYLFEDFNNSDKLSNYEKITQCFKALAKYFISHPKPQSINSFNELQQNAKQVDSVNDKSNNLSLKTTNQIVNSIIGNPRNPNTGTIPLTQNKPSTQDLKRKMSLMAAEMNAIINIGKDGLKMQGYTKKYTPKGINSIVKLLERPVCPDDAANHISNHCLCAFAERHIIETFEELYQILKECNKRYQETPHDKQPLHVTPCYVRFFKHIEPLHKQWCDLQQQNSKMTNDNCDIEDDNWQLKMDNWFYP